MRFGHSKSRDRSKGSRTRIDHSQDEEETPYIKDFTFYKSRFSQRHKAIQLKLKDFSKLLEANNSLTAARSS